MKLKNLLLIYLVLWSAGSFAAQSPHQRWIRFQAPGQEAWEQAKPSDCLSSWS